MQHWITNNQGLPDLPVLWDVIVADENGVELRIVPGKCKRCAQASSTIHAATAVVDQTGKENAQSEAVKTIAHKLAALSTIVNRRRMCTKGQKVSACCVVSYVNLVLEAFLSLPLGNPDLDKVIQAIDNNTMAELATSHGQLGLNEMLSWGRCESLRYEHCAAVCAKLKNSTLFWKEVLNAGRHTIQLFLCNLFRLYLMVHMAHVWISGQHHQ
jgi:hypothetical protein